MRRPVLGLAAGALAGVLAAGVAATGRAASQDSGHPATFGSGHPATFDYVYTEANEGGSSGGHAAIRFGEHTYHFQNRDGLLVLDREPTRDFFHVYALINNRTIHLSRVAVSAQDARRLRERFERRRRIEARQLEVRAGLLADRSLLEGWRAAAAGGDAAEASPEIPALGYFAGAREARAAPAATVTGLRHRIEERYGRRFLASRRRDATRRLEVAVAADPAAWIVVPPRDAYEDPPFSRSYAGRYRDAATEIAVLEVLEHSAPLAAGASIEPAGPEYWLEARERERLRSLRAGLEDQLVDLAGSARSDWGRPFLVGLARLLALDASLDRGRLVLLDVVPDDARALAARVLASRLDVVSEMARAGRGQVEEARRQLLESKGVDERAWGRLEEAANRVHELDRAVREGRDLRLARGVLVPGRARRLEIAIPREADLHVLDRDLARVRERERGYQAALEQLYRYQLVTRNCVSELFETVNEALGADAARSEVALGGYVDGHSAFTFIPFVSAVAVNARYRVVERRTLPSQREIRLAQMRRRENDLWVVLRESNTLTARSYRRSARDSFFLFFTDDAVPLRPVFGALNLAAALGESLWGLVRLPIDRGETLVSGLEGALTSLPELAFGNIRKGSNDWVPPRTQSVDD